MSLQGVGQKQVLPRRAVLESDSKQGWKKARGKGVDSFTASDLSGWAKFTVTTAKIALILNPITTFLTTAGCEPHDYHKCIDPDEECPSGPIHCWYDDDGDERCDCKSGYTEECGRNGCSCVKDEPYYDHFGSFDDY